MTAGKATLEDLCVYSWETASLPPDALAALEAQAGRVLERAEGVPIVTCQRFEVVALTPALEGDAPRVCRGANGLLHIAAVAAGVESLVLGEAEVLGQVRSALATASPSLRRATAPAIAAARALRREEGFTGHAGFALDNALEHANLPPGGSLAVVGGGPMGRRVAERGVELGFDVTLVARRPLALPPAVRYQPFSNLSRLAATDVLVTCLGRAAPQLCRSDLPEVQSLAVDLATPCNLAGEFDAPVVRLAHLLGDQRNSRVEQARRTALRGRLETLLVARFTAGERDSPLGSVREEVERIRRQELVRSLRLHPDLPAEKLDTITRSLVNQIFHRPSLRLRQSDDETLVAAVAALFSDASEEAR